MILPPSHPQRREANDEVHARPPEVMAAPARVSYLALLADAAECDAARRAIAALAEQYGVAPPALGANHYRGDFGAFRLRWERHTEFHRVQVMLPGLEADPFAAPAIAALPPEWVAALPGKLVMAAHLAFAAPQQPEPEPAVLAARLFAGNAVIGAEVQDGAAVALTDFHIHADGFSRFWVQDRSLTPGQGGRLVQRLLEIDTYRIMALLALPVARELVPFLASREQELAEITTALTAADEADEPVLLGRLTRLAAEVESREASNLYRFSAAAAYDELVQRRIGELRERRIEGLQTLQEFTERRLAPAMSTCRAATAREEALSQRTARATQLLSTRVALTRERQNSDVLDQLNRRARQQVRLQQTVEGFSIVAITYYCVGLLAYAVKGLASYGVNVNADFVIGVAIMPIAVIIALGVRTIRQRLARGRN